MRVDRPTAHHPSYNTNSQLRQLRNPISLFVLALEPSPSPYIMVSIVRLFPRVIPQTAGGARILDQLEHLKLIVALWSTCPPAMMDETK